MPDIWFPAVSLSFDVCMCLCVYVQTHMCVFIYLPTYLLATLSMCLFLTVYLPSMYHYRHSRNERIKEWRDSSKGCNDIDATADLVPIWIVNPLKPYIHCMKHGFRCLPIVLGCSSLLDCFAMWLYLHSPFHCRWASIRMLSFCLLYRHGYPSIYLWFSIFQRFFLHCISSSWSSFNKLIPHYFPKWLYAFPLEVDS